MSRFRAEARTMATLSWHPRVAEVHDAGTTATGEPYLVMEFLEGASLADQLREHGPMDWTDVTAIGVQVADALAAAHAARVVHRDVKPANVLADGRGSVKLGDFGIALVEGGTHTDGRSLFGTLAVPGAGTGPGGGARITRGGRVLAGGDAVRASRWLSGPCSGGRVGRRRLPNPSRA